MEKRQVIDGQQRLTTLQIFLTAFRDFCRAQGAEEMAREVENFTLNKGMMAEPEVDKFKVWPTQLDRAQFKDVVMAGSRVELEKQHPLVRQKYARSYDPRPKMVEAYFFFYDSLSTFFLGSVNDPALCASVALALRLEESFQALKNALQVVVIDLEAGDDAQVIFETLNARGEPLLPADLLRNFIFLRAARMGESQENLYDQYWKQFDDRFWREEVRQGRLSRPRSDLFMQHFLSSRQYVDIPVKHLFVEYKFWISNKKPFATVHEELATLARQGSDFRRIIAPAQDDHLRPLMEFMQAFEISTAYPLLLSLLDAKVPEPVLNKIGIVLESYLLRRAVCGYTTKNYNRIFLQLTKSIRRESINAQRLSELLLEFKGDSTEWPTDDCFTKAWMDGLVYGRLNNPKIVYILKRINSETTTNRHEIINVSGELTVEHLMPQAWVQFWPLPDGTLGMSEVDQFLADRHEPRFIASKQRDAVIQTFGNLTIITQPLNSAVSNNAWLVKKPVLLQSSLLPINSMLSSIDSWDESAIHRRGKDLLAYALKIWPRPIPPH